MLSGWGPLIISSPLLISCLSVVDERIMRVSVDLVDAGGVVVQEGRQGEGHGGALDVGPLAAVILGEVEVVGPRLAGLGGGCEDDEAAAPKFVEGGVLVDVAGGGELESHVGGSFRSVSDEGDDAVAGRVGPVAV